MSSKVIIVSTCVKEVVSDTLHPQTFEFSFKGTLTGVTIGKIHLTHIRPVEVGIEYLMYVEVEKMEKSVLTGKILKIKPLNECMGRD